SSMSRHSLTLSSSSSSTLTLCHPPPPEIYPLSLPTIFRSPGAPAGLGEHRPAHRGQRDDRAHGEVDAAADDHEGQRHREDDQVRSEEHTSELQSRFDLVCRLLLEKKHNQQRSGSYSEAGE